VLVSRFCLQKEAFEMKQPSSNIQRYVQEIKNSGLSIYDHIDIGDPKLWIPSLDLEVLLNERLSGCSLSGLPLRTRSKVAKQLVCEALGYPVPSSFKKTRPRFPGQSFDTYVQKRNNVQVYNEDISPSRRYILIRLDNNELITQVKVITGDTLALLDTTGKLTRKYQARLVIRSSRTELISTDDSSVLKPLVSDDITLTKTASPIDQPERGQIMSIALLFSRLASLVGIRFPDAGSDQERNRGAALHRIVCQCLGYSEYRDNGRFPDVRHQLLEIKLQTSPTIDLGIVCPDSKEVLDVPMIERSQIRHCDVRYALFYAQTDGQEVTLTHFFLTTGEKFFSRFHLCKGNVLNGKLQIPLPRDFFDR